MSLTAIELKAEMLQAREKGQEPHQRRAAFEAWFAQACREGHPPDVLRRSSPIESERFWARTVPGPDGHMFWIGGKEFWRNATETPRGCRPARWIWMREHGPIPTTDTVSPTCGEPRCVTLEHLACERRDGLPAFIPDDRLIGRLQVVAMELGYSPSSKEWEKRKESPTAFCYMRRWGSWAAATAAAGLPPVVHALTRNRVTPERALDSLRAAIKEFGRPPQRDEYRAWCQAAPEERVSHETIKRRHGGASWSTLISKALEGGTE